MIRVASEEVHYFKENELGEQLKNATQNIWAKAHGLSAISKLVEHAITDAEYNEDVGVPLSKSDISYAVGALSDYASIIASNISQINELIGCDNVTKVLNTLDADSKILGFEFKYRPKTFKEDRAKAKTA
jgi:ribosomal protein L22